MIKGYCRTNLDNYNNIKWPEVFCEVPRKGDCVRSICGKKQLKVVRIIHFVPNRYEAENKVPMIEVELNN